LPPQFDEDEGPASGRSIPPLTGHVDRGVADPVLDDSAERRSLGPETVAESLLHAACGVTDALAERRKPDVDFGAVGVRVDASVYSYFTNFSRSSRFAPWKWCRSASFSGSTFPRFAETGAIVSGVHCFQGG